MTRGRQISNRDLERLSAYLDGALSAKEASRLEARLQEDPILQQALHDLKETARLVASLSEVPLPRSFTLTPEMAGIRDRPRVYPVMRLATALATFTFLVVVGVDAISSFTLKGALAPVREEQAAMEVPAPVANAMATGEVPAEELDLEEFKMAQVEQEEMSQAPALAGEVEGQMDRMAPTSVLGTTAETEHFAPGVEMTEAPAPVGTPTPAASGAAAIEEGVEDEGAEFEPSPTLEIQPTPFPSLTPTSPPAGITVQPEPRSVLRAVEFSLGALAIILAGLTLWISRKD